MKNFTKILFGFLALMIAVSSCNKSTDYSDIIEQQRIADSIENARVKKLILDQAPQLKQFAEANFTNPTLDTASGIWYELTAAATDTSYVYQFDSYGYLVYPKIAVKYAVNLLDGTQIGTTVDQNLNETATSLLLLNRNTSWQIAFFPKKMAYNSIQRTVGGLTSKGLKKGNKIRFVTPSPWGEDTKATEKIPANSPLYTEIEIETINN